MFVYIIIFIFYDRLNFSIPCDISINIVIGIMSDVIFMTINEITRF